MEHTLVIDDEAKAKILLIKSSDKDGYPYYTGKFQFPGTLEFDAGISFMVFVSEEGQEELQIAPLDPSRRSRATRNEAILSHKLSINLHPQKDINGKTYYIGEAMGVAELKLRHGIFFAIFVSREGEEEIQISRLKPPKSKKRMPEKEWRAVRQGA